MSRFLTVGKAHRALSITALVALVMLGVMIGGANPASAQKKPGKINIEDLIRGEGTKYVQLRSFMAPAYHVGKRGTHQRPITIVMEVPDYKKVHGICRMGPRIQAKLTETLYSHPIPIGKDRSIDDETMSEQRLLARLAHAANKSLRQKGAISNIYLIDGTKKLSGGMKARLPFSSVLGCKEIRDLPEETKKEK